MKKFLIGTFFIAVLLFGNFIADAAIRTFCIVQQAGEAGTWLEGSCRDGGNSCGQVCVSFQD